MNGQGNKNFLDNFWINFCLEFFFKSQIEANKHLQNDINYQPLDYQKIINHFLSKTDPIRTCAILQALRWRITKTKGAYMRREIVITFASFDIIGI